VKNQDKFRHARGSTTTAIAVLGLIAICSATPRAEGQEPNGWNSVQAPPPDSNDRYRFDGSGQAGPALNGSQGLTSLGTYNFQNETLVAPWRPPQNQDLAAPAQAPEPPPADTSAPVTSEGAPTFNAFSGIGPTIQPPLPSATSPSKIISSDGSIISVPAGTWPASNPLPSGTGSPAAPAAKGWLYYVCQGATNAKDGAAVAASLKGLGVENEALDTLAEALSSH
jgi:hypothetical protein